MNKGSNLSFWSEERFYSNASVVEMEETAEVRLYSEVRLLAVPHLSYFDRFRRLNLAGLRFLVQCKQSCRTTLQLTSQVG